MLRRLQTILSIPEDHHHSSSMVILTCSKTMSTTLTTCLGQIKAPMRALEDVPLQESKSSIAELGAAVLLVDNEESRYINLFTVQSMANA